MDGFGFPTIEFKVTTNPGLFFCDVENMKGQGTFVYSSPSLRSKIIGLIAPGTLVNVVTFDFMTGLEGDQTASQERISKQEWYEQIGIHAGHEALSQVQTQSEIVGADILIVEGLEWAWLTEIKGWIPSWATHRAAAKGRLLASLKGTAGSFQNLASVASIRQRWR